MEQDILWRGHRPPYGVTDADLDELKSCGKSKYRDTALALIPLAIGLGLNALNAYIANQAWLLNAGVGLVCLVLGVGAFIVSIDMGGNCEEVINRIKDQPKVTYTQAKPTPTRGDEPEPEDQESSTGGVHQFEPDWLGEVVWGQEDLDYGDEKPSWLANERGLHDDR